MIAWALYWLAWAIAGAGTFILILETGGHLGAAVLVAGVEVLLAVGVSTLMDS